MAGETTEQHHGGVSSFLQGLTNLAKPATIEGMISRLEDGNLQLVQTRACHSLAAKAKVRSRPAAARSIYSLGFRA